MIKDPTKVAIAAAPAMEIALAVATNSNNCSRHRSKNYSEARGRSKPKSFSLFGWRKGCEVKEKEEDKGEHKKKLRFDASQVLKRKERKSPIPQATLFIFQELRGRGGECSAPASMRTSPTNSGLLLATASLPSSTIQWKSFIAAIQAAIAHCKNSIAAEEKMKC
ncbi:LOW QUALITY PROTEIN: hypothetical protein NC652_004867 [Populus alba x Populus x berolinensis]|nr:LOW QUALITY PROTEIN: hypothetical protein NC652_004867 [Populus alba x Populus x berolinensis]